MLLRVRVARLVFAVGLPLVSACSRQDATPPIVVQGAMEIEIRTLAARIENAREEKVKGWTFWRGTVDGYPVVISKTLKGMSNAAAATVLAAERYHPAAIINQGTAGGHQPELHVYDIVLGTASVNLGSFKTGQLPRGKGSEIGTWVPLDLTRADGSASQDPNAHVIRRFNGDERLLAAARGVRDKYQQGRVLDGVIGSSEIWNSEIDRIEYFHERFSTTAEEMETASAAQIAGLYEIPFLGIRVLSNNITNDGAYDPKTATACQEYVYEVVKAYVNAKRR